jgi:urease subunit beta
MIPGEIIGTNEPVTVNEGLPVTTLTMTNTGPLTVQLTAHFHVFEANKWLRFDREKAYGMRIDTHAKGAVRIPAGESRDIDLVPIGGRRVIHGFNGAVNGPLDELDAGDATERLAERGFLHEPAP